MILFEHVNFREFFWKYVNLRKSFEYFFVLWCLDYLPSNFCMQTIRIVENEFLKIIPFVKNNSRDTTLHSRKSAFDCMENYKKLLFRQIYNEVQTLCLTWKRIFAFIWKIVWVFYKIWLVKCKLFFGALQSTMWLDLVDTSQILSYFRIKIA